MARVVVTERSARMAAEPDTHLLKAAPLSLWRSFTFHLSPDPDLDLFTLRASPRVFCVLASSVAQWLIRAYCYSIFWAQLGGLLNECVERSVPIMSLTAALATFWAGLGCYSAITIVAVSGRAGARMLSRSDPVMT